MVILQVVGLVLLAGQEVVALVGRFQCRVKHLGRAILILVVEVIQDGDVPEGRGNP